VTRNARRAFLLGEVDQKNWERTTHLAMRRALSLATLEEKLKAAAVAWGVPLFSAGVDATAMSRLSDLFSSFFGDGRRPVNPPPPCKHLKSSESPAPFASQTQTAAPILVSCQLETPQESPPVLGREKRTFGIASESFEPGFGLA
jgi:hypothetical protein